MVGNGPLEKLSATIELQFEVGDILFKEYFRIMNHFRSPIFGLLFLQRNITILDMRQEVLNFPLFPCNSNMQTTRTLKITNPTHIPKQPRKQTVIHIKSQIYKDNAITGIIQTSLDLEDKDELIIYHALTNTQQWRNTVLIKTFLEHQYTLKKACHTATLSTLTPDKRNV